MKSKQIIIIFWTGDGFNFTNQNMEVKVELNKWNKLEARNKNNEWNIFEKILYVEKMENTWKIETPKHLYIIKPGESVSVDEFNGTMQSIKLLAEGSNQLESGNPQSFLRF